MKANKIIRWKVVDGERKSIHIRPPEINQCFRPYKQLEYPKGKKVIAPKKSKGIFCFSSKKEAKSFSIDYLDREPKILKVKTYGNSQVPIGVNPFGDGFPDGTICYSAVMPLE